MTELNLEVGQKCWSIQLGVCEVIEINENKTYKCKSLHGSKIDWINYESNGKISPFEHHPSLFLSNPFENKLVQGNKDGWVEPKENKADLINALCRIRESFVNRQILIDVETKLKKLLESI